MPLLSIIRICLERKRTVYMKSNSSPPFLCCNWSLSTVLYCTLTVLYSHSILSRTSAFTVKQCTGKAKGIPKIQYFKCLALLIFFVKSWWQNSLNSSYLPQIKKVGMTAYLVMPCAHRVWSTGLSPTMTLHPSQNQTCHMPRSLPQSAALFVLSNGG